MTTTKDVGVKAVEVDRIIQVIRKGANGTGVLYYKPPKGKDQLCIIGGLLHVAGVSFEDLGVSDPRSIPDAVHILIADYGLNLDRIVELMRLNDLYKTIANRRKKLIELVESWRGKDE